MNFESLTILPGTNKAGEPEHFAPVTLHPGELCAIAGNTGSGKSRLIKDIEQQARNPHKQCPCCPDGSLRSFKGAHRPPLPEHALRPGSQCPGIFKAPLPVPEPSGDLPRRCVSYGKPDHTGASTTGRKFKPPKRRPDPGTYDRRPCLHL